MHAFFLIVSQTYTTNYIKDYSTIISNKLTNELQECVFKI